MEFCTEILKYDKKNLNFTEMTKHLLFNSYVAIPVPMGDKHLYECVFIARRSINNLLYSLGEIFQEIFISFDDPIMNDK